MIKFRGFETVYTLFATEVLSRLNQLFIKEKLAFFLIMTIWRWRGKKYYDKAPCNYELLLPVPKWKTGVLHHWTF